MAAEDRPFTVQFRGVELAAAGPPPPLPQKITEISGRLSVVPFAMRTERNMSVALYAVVQPGSPKIIPYRVGAVIGKGSFSKVYELVPVNHRHHHATYALKAFNRSSADHGGQHIELERRLAGDSAMRAVMVPAMRVKGTIPFDDLLMTRCPGSLRLLLDHTLAQPGTVAEAVAHAVFALQTTLIDRGYIHTDINVSNLLYYVVGKDQVRLMLGDYGGLHKIGWKLMGCCTIGLPEYDYASYVRIGTPEQARAAARFLAASAGCSVYMHRRHGPLYGALCYKGADVVKDRESAYQRLRKTMGDAGCHTIYRWLDREPLHRESEYVNLDAMEPTPSPEGGGAPEGSPPSE